VSARAPLIAAHPDDANSILATPFQSQPGLEGFQPMDVESWAKAHRGDFGGAETAG
jgi:hypothetical protein